MPGSMIDRALGQAGPPVGGAARMLQAALSDIADTLDVLGLRGRHSGPEIDARDPEYIRATLPTVSSVCRRYFRGEVSGLENIPDGPVLLVGNHSGGTLIADTFVFAQAFYAHFGAERRLSSARS